MKYLLALVLFVGVWGCVQKELTYEQKLAKLINQEMNNGEVNNEIFLGYELGMSPQEYEKHTKKLLEEGRIYEGEYGEYKYDMNVGVIRPAEVTWIPVYYTGSDSTLYSLTLSVSKESSDMTNPLYLNLYILYRNKYGKPSKTVPHNSKNLSWTQVDGNRLIQISQINVDESLVQYVDIRLRKKEKEHRQNKVSKTSEDI